MAGGGSLSVSSTASGGGEEEGKEGEKRDLTRLMTPLKGSADRATRAVDRESDRGYIRERYDVSDIRGNNVF